MLADIKKTTTRTNKKTNESNAKQDKLMFEEIFHVMSVTTREKHFLIHAIGQRKGKANDLLLLLRLSAA